MRNIKKIAVIGSGIMGSGIACHFANIGIEVLLLDILPKDNPSTKEARNAVATLNFKRALKSSPSPIYDLPFANLVTMGNIEDDLEKIKTVDWVIEVVVERLEIKKDIFEKIEKYRKQGTLISTNTSGIPMHLMLDGRSEDFKTCFCGTHFFNPVRYLKLLEIIPSADTSPEVVDFHMKYGKKFLGKTTVLCKDTPAFIGNRIGVFSIMHLFRLTETLDLTVSQVDKLAGSVIGRPKSATFRTADIVGLDTMVHVANDLFRVAVEDEMKPMFALPDYLTQLVKNNWLGEKSGQGFYKKVTNDKGEKQIFELDLKTLDYRLPEKVSFATLASTKSIESVSDRFKVLIQGTDKAGDFYRSSIGALLAYASNRIGEIADDYYPIDDAMRGGFGWKHGPFEIWDAIGLKEGLKLAYDQGYQPAQWVEAMLEKGIDKFYQVDDKGRKCFYDRRQEMFVVLPGQDEAIFLDNIRKTHTIWKNKEASIIDIGDGVLNLEFHSKMNSLGQEVMKAINKAIDIAEEDYKGLVIFNEGENFSVGANLMTIFMLSVEQEYEELHYAIKYFQDTVTRLRYSAIPVVVAPHNMAIGGGCELILHADKVVAYAETYMGLVEVGVGLIPAGGGTKEMTLRALEDAMPSDIEINRIREAFLGIGMGKVSTSAHEAMNMKYLKKGRDVIVLNRDNQLAIAKKYVLLMYEQGYTQPTRNQVKVMGKQVLGMFKVGVDAMEDGSYISSHDKKIAERLGYVMAGGDLSEPETVTDQYLLTLEREAFLSLCTEKKTLERIQFMLEKGKALRN